MKHLRRRTSRAILVPFALFVLVLGGALPASAAPLQTTADYISIGPDSLSW